MTIQKVIKKGIIEKDLRFDSTVLKTIWCLTRCTKIYNDGYKAEIIRLEDSAGTEENQDKSGEDVGLEVSSIYVAERSLVYTTVGNDWQLW